MRRLARWFGLARFKDAAAYYGPDQTFREFLTLKADTWRPVHREATGNALEIRPRRGVVVNRYPLVVATDSRQRADVTFRGGLGYVAVTFAGLPEPRGYQLRLDGQRVDQTVHGNDFWQTDYDVDAKRWRMTFNVRLEGGSSPTHTLRLVAGDRNARRN